ncbi:MAG: DNA primase, partial [Candidatus Veblenbacteria bacterium]|nr:DNA primase [Candidatus Veblenbacteria bacterium]
MANDVEQIKSRLDIIEVVGEYIRLKQSGQNWKGLCPFHGEKTPSLMVHREKQIWHCFGCGLGGDVFEFIEKIENVEFPEALEILARKAGVELTSRQGGGPEAGKRLRLFHLLEVATAFYREQLKSSASGAVARAYLAKRGVTPESVADFSLGYAPPEWDKLTNHLRNNGFSIEEALLSGVAMKSERGPGVYDRFRDRLLFPITDAQSRVVGFGGRTLDPEAKEAKYINSPQGPIYNKSLILYNLDKAKLYIKEAGCAVLVEGYMDIIGSWEAGVRNVVATSGTALTPEQVKLLKRYTNELRLAFDADLAGRTASERGIDLALQAELEVKVIKLPQGKDPDDAARVDAVGFKSAVESALPIGDYAFATVLGQVDTTTREGKKQAAKLLLAAIVKLPDPVDRDYYLKRLARELDVDERSLRERLPVNRTPVAGASPEPVTEPVAKPSREQLLSERLLVLLVGFGPELWPLTLGLEAGMLAPVWSELYRQAAL